jgi:hypothetical protein
LVVVLCIAPIRKRSKERDGRPAPGESFKLKPIRQPRGYDKSQGISRRGLSWPMEPLFCAAFYDLFMPAA